MAFCGAVAEHDLVVLLQPRQRGRIREVTAFAVRDWNANHFALGELIGEWKVVALGDQVSPLASKLHRRVADERPWQQARFTKDLESVADAPDEPAAIGEF